MNASFEEYQPFYGFDKLATPDWQMVPLNGEKYVYLKNADNLTVEVKNPAIAKVSEKFETTNNPAQKKRLFQIKGLSYGKTFLEAKEKNIVKARLEIGVKKPRVISLSFNFVRGSIATIKSATAVPRWMEVLRAIYVPQTNIYFIQKSVNTITPKYNFGRDFNVINANLSPIEWDTLVKHRDSFADVNLFFVNKIVWFTSKTAWDSPKGVTTNKDCIIGDYQLRNDEFETIVIGHEIAHALGVRGDKHFYHKKNSFKIMMFYRTTLAGRGIPKVHAEIVNP